MAAQLLALPVSRLLSTVLMFTKFVIKILGRLCCWHHCSVARYSNVYVLRLWSCTPRSLNRPICSRYTWFHLLVFRQLAPGDHPI